MQKDQQNYVKDSDTAQQAAGKGLSKLADQRRHLDLEMALMTDRKVSKLIEMVQNLRSDMPQVENHYDAEADAMQEKTDPDKVLTTPEQTLKDAAS